MLFGTESRRVVPTTSAAVIDDDDHVPSPTTKSASPTVASSARRAIVLYSDRRVAVSPGGSVDSSPVAIVSVDAWSNVTIGIDVVVDNRSEVGGQHWCARSRSTVTHRHIDTCRDMRCV
jgi:hypothetical protein